ncbi:MAG: hypothetical protein HW395_998, partial [candidate division NC10 bacterium]|nr:hypothetical protein [candidate division NC10 bacterium]
RETMYRESVTRAFTERAMKIAEAVLLAIEEWERSEGVV